VSVGSVIRISNGLGCRIFYVDSELNSKTSDTDKCKNHTHIRKVFVSTDPKICCTVPNKHFASSCPTRPKPGALESKLNPFIASLWPKRGLGLSSVPYRTPSACAKMATATYPVGQTKIPFCPKNTEILFSQRFRSTLEVALLRPPHRRRPASDLDQQALWPSAT
jgi:hypothetical protein